METVPPVSPAGRQLQRYDTKGRFQVVGCIPYRYRSGNDDTMSDKVEVLLIRSWDGPGLQFPEGGWELDETPEEAAQRLSLIKAGVVGKVEHKLGKWNFLRKSNGTFNGVHMFSLLVKKQLELWPQENVEQRMWMTVDEARILCPHWWMKEALDTLVERFTSSKTQEEEIPLIDRQSNEVQPIIGSFENGDYCITIEPDINNVDHKTKDRRNDCRQKVSLEWIFVITNFVLELFSVVLDQLSSMHQPQYALFAMLISFSAMLICIVELIYKGRKERVMWRWRSWLPWFYDASQNYKPFGSFKDIVGSVCALCQCIVTGINYAEADKTVNISVWPIIFAFGLLCSKMVQNPERRAIV